MLSSVNHYCGSVGKALEKRSSSRSSIPSFFDVLDQQSGSREWRRSVLVEHLFAPFGLVDKVVALIATGIPDPSAITRLMVQAVVSTCVKRAWYPRCRAVHTRRVHTCLQHRLEGGTSQPHHSTRWDLSE